MKELKVASCFEFEKVLRGRSNKLFYSKSEVDAVLDEKDKEIAELKEQYKDMDVTHTVHIAKMNAKIEELEYSLESEKDSRYADSVDAGMRERRLKRALYKACANWAHHRVFVRYKTNEKAWENVERKCGAKAEEYK